MHVNGFHTMIERTQSANWCQPPPSHRRGGIRGGLARGVFVCPKYCRFALIEGDIQPQVEGPGSSAPIYWLHFGLSIMG